MERLVERCIFAAGRVLRSVVPGLRRRDNKRDFLLERMPSGGRCAEIGVDRGDFSRRILEINRPAELHLIDPWSYREADDYSDARYGGERGGGQDQMDTVHSRVKERFREEIASGTVHIHRAKSIETAQKFPDEYLDWVYIDGNHFYEFVWEDLQAYTRKVRHSGFITGDDYGVEGWWDDGVTRAVDDFVETADVEPVMFRQHQFILRRT